MPYKIFLFALLTSFAATCSAQHTQRISPSGTSASIDYLFVDSDDPSPLHPAYTFVDTLYLPSSWHRIYPGPNSIPNTNPNAVCWRAIKNDSTDNTFAGPIPIGFSYNFFDVNYDSVYLSSNGFIGFGNFARAIGSDGPSFANYFCGALPDTLAPKAIAAFMMTDGEMLRTNFDSSRAFYRTSQSLDSFFITVYNFYHISGTSAANTVHNFRCDVQIVFAKADSSITFHYRKFYGTHNIGLEIYTAENIFRNGCIPNPCTTNAAVIGLQNETQTSGTNYLCNGSFTAPGAVPDLHSGLAVKFRRWNNIAMADSIIWPIRNFEMMAGDSLVPVAAFRNVSGAAQSFHVQLRIRSLLSGNILYQSIDSVQQLAAGASQRITFSKWIIPDTGTSSQGMMMIEAITQSSGDAWHGDDTLRQFCFVLSQQNSFQDFNNNFTTPSLLQVSIPNVLQWVNIGATVVDGEINSLLPPPPRGPQGLQGGTRLQSPVILLDRRDINGNEYNRCAFGGSDLPSSGGGPIGDGGVGDTIISFPIDLSNLKPPKYAVLGFSYERSGNHEYPRWYDLATAIGPERTVTQPDTTKIYRAGDSLEVAFADSSQLLNVSTWHEKVAIDGGKDFHFNRAYISIDSNYFTNHFRFRIRLKAKNDFEPGNPSDDFDEWYLDNFVVVSPVKPEVEVSWVRVNPDWAYQRVPASQAITVPIEVSIANNGGLAGAAFGLCVIINARNSPATSYPSGLYAKLITIPVLSPQQTNIVHAPTWNARLAGPGEYALSAFLLPKGYDAESQNDSTYNSFTLQFDSSYVYDNGVNDIPGFFQMPGLGLKMPEFGSFGDPVGGGDGENGSIATKFILYQRDTLVGVQLWFGSFNTSGDAIRLSVYTSNGSYPGDTIAGGRATFQTVRSAPWDNWSMYKFPCCPIVLEPGEYWLSVSQLRETGMELGATAYKSSCDWLVYDPSPNLNHVFNVNYSEMINRFAFENTAGSQSWFPFYFPYGNVGKAAYSYYEANSAAAKNSVTCNKTYNCFWAQGSWIPLIRPYFGVKSYGPRLYDTVYANAYGPAFNRDSLAFGTITGCAASAPTFMDSIRASIPQYEPEYITLTMKITGPEASDFTLINGTSTVLGLDYWTNYSASIVIGFHPHASGLRTATLIVYNDAGRVPGTDSIPITATFIDGIVHIQTDSNFFGAKEIGTSNYLSVGLNNLGTIDDTIENISITPKDPAIFISKTPPVILQGNASDSLTVCFVPYDTTTKTAVVTITSNPCNRKHTITFTGTGIPATGISQLPATPCAATLAQNRPNPFSDETIIPFSLAQSGRCKIRISDLLGRVQIILCDEFLPAGDYTKKFSAKNFVSGIYLCSLETNGVVIQKMVNVEKEGKR